MNQILVQKSAYFSIALQISSVVLLALRSVMAKFLERFASRRVTLFTAFWATLLFVQERSTIGPWALVLNSSSNFSRSSSCTRVRVFTYLFWIFINSTLKTHFLNPVLALSDGILYEHTILINFTWSMNVFLFFCSSHWYEAGSVAQLEKGDITYFLCQSGFNKIWTDSWWVVVYAVSTVSQI